MKLGPADKLLLVWLVLVGGMCVASHLWGFRVIVARSGESIVMDNSRGVVHVAWTRRQMSNEHARIEWHDRGGKTLFPQHRDIALHSWDVLTGMGLRLYRQHPISLDNAPLSRRLIVSHVLLLALPVALWLPFQRWRWRRPLPTAPAA